MSYFRNINQKIQELSGFLQNLEITKSSEILTPKSKQKFLQTEIKKVSTLFRFGQCLMKIKITVLIYFTALTFSKRSTQSKKIQ